jgi:hypothetical protein
MGSGHPIYSSYPIQNSILNREHARGNFTFRGPHVHLIGSDSLADYIVGDSKI